MELWIIIVIVVAVVAAISALLAVGNYAGDKFADAYEKAFSISAGAHVSVLEFVTEQNYAHFDGKLKISRTKKVFGDAYASKNKTLILTDKTLGSTSVGAFAVAAHELGHALQDKESKKVKALNTMRTIGWIVGKLFLPLILAFVVLIFFQNLQTYALIIGGVAAGIFLFAVIIKLFIISIEKDASSRAIKMLDEFVPDAQMKDVKKILNAARLTYWSDLVRLLFGWSGLVRKTKLFGK